MSQPARLLARLLPTLAACSLCLLAATSAEAQYKVIGADGKVTYTDREPNASEGRVVPLGARAAAAATSEAELPFELRQIAAKYPVTLYVITTACDPCSAARSLLKQRGIPFSERMVVSVEDSDALEKITGARDAPTLTIGSQTLRGLSSDAWNSYLDAAGYPRTSLLPANYQYRSATPVVERAPDRDGRQPHRRSGGAVHTDGAHRRPQRHPVLGRTRFRRRRCPLGTVSRRQAMRGRPHRPPRRLDG